MFNDLNLKMIIDIHAHLSYNKINPESFILNMFENENANLKRSDLSVLLQLFFNDRYCKQIIKQMDHANISKTVLQIIDCGIGIEEPEYEISAIHQMHHYILTKYSDRFLVFSGVDPRRGKLGLDLFKKGVEKYGFKGLKLYPPLGYAPNDHIFEPYYEICKQYNLPVLIHFGPSQKNMRNEFSNSNLIYETTKKHNNINFILAHTGYILGDVALQKLIKLPNVFFDISGFQSKFSKVDNDMINAMKYIFSKEYCEKVLFGSDWPLFNIMTPLKTHVDLINKLFEEVGAEKNAFENVMYNNAKRILNLD